MNACPAFKGLNAARHHHIVDLITKELRRATGQQTQFHINKTVQADWFASSQSNNTFNNIAKSSPNTQDIIMINETTKSVSILECSFDMYMDTCFSCKILKYQPLV